MSEMEEKKEKGKGKEEKEEEVILDHFYHEHPLTLTLSKSYMEYVQCYGCRRYIVSGETVYMCDKCWASPVLHEECAEMPREIRLSMHPQHTLIQRVMVNHPTCAVCEGKIRRIGYYCSSPDSCSFNIHVGCAPDTNMLKRCIDHPSHSHQLTWLWRPCLSRCDACGTTQRGNSSYICSDCNYWIHESCKDLPPKADYCHLHHHPLSLAFHLPPEYIKFNFPCAICFKEFLPKYWVYHCAFCRYVVHIKCAIKSSPANTKNIDANAAGNKDVITFPVNNAVGDLIGPFVTKVGGAMAIPHDNGKYKFHNHDHELSLILCPFHDEKEQKEEEEYSDDDDDDLNLTTKSKLICDGCTTPIYQRRYHSSSKSCNYYLSCGECKYFLHWECFHLPHELPYHPLHQIDGHNLMLKTPPKFNITHCDICGAYTNGFIYKCTKCWFEVDMKCASLPEIIKHAAHPHHHLKLLSREITSKGIYWNRLCGACGLPTYGDACYKCGICEFIVHSSCASLPAAVTNPAWDRHHPLPLTFDATLNRPGDFYCDVCEEEMNPRTWMYHCRSCDISFHPRCFPTASGKYRNIKFMQHFVVAAVHPHPVAYQLLTKKLRCDVCGERKEYGCFGFQCAEDKCYFFMCLKPCARNYLDASLFDDRLFVLKNETMSEMEEKKEKEKEKEEEEEVILDHFCHHHPLTLTKSDSEYELCFGCTRYIVSGETVYKCRAKCRRSPILHEECAEMPREIRLSMHPQHTLIQTEDMNNYPTCAVCEDAIMRIGYYCSSPDSCGFNIHVGCAPNKGMLKRRIDQRCMAHRSHPHELALQWRPGWSCLLRCDACGTIQRGNFYICIECEYWIHESCADLPAIAYYRHLHHHPLSLAFNVPPEYIKFHFACDICFKKFLPKHWVYHCEICRYVAHIKCAIKASPTNINYLDASLFDDRLFVLKNETMSEMEEKKEKEKEKEEEEEVILDHFCHHHPLTLTKSDSEYELCFGCTRYIVSGETVYKCRAKCRRSPILHEECAEMPREIRLSMHPQHTLIQTEDMNNYPTCAVCEDAIMRIGYYCSSPDSCGFNIHVGCAPNKGMLKRRIDQRCIGHPSHPHELALQWRPGWSCLLRCDACGTIQRGNFYICIECEYWIHESCADLPAIAYYRHLHHHPLSLAFNVPPEYIKFHFACDICFKKFLPKHWVYHCEICRYVAHIKCAIKASPTNINCLDALEAAD